jgi:hypothetical protein
MEGQVYLAGMVISALWIALCIYLYRRSYRRDRKVSVKSETFSDTRDVG